MFLASGLVSGKGATCFHCCPSANHKTSVCQKSEEITVEDFWKESSASGSSAAKRSKPVPQEDKKELENQLKKACLEGMREGLEKREANLSSSQGSSKQDGRVR